MAQEFTINSSAIESKINQLLPSQGGFGAGVDLSASTMVIPIVDLTETAEGSDVRPDLQTAFSLTSNSSFAVFNTTTTLANTTGYWRVYGNAYASGGGDVTLSLTDGTTTKVIFNNTFIPGTLSNNPFEFIVFLPAGDELIGISSTTSVVLYATLRQIADVQGNLINPL